MLHPDDQPRRTPRNRRRDQFVVGYAPEKNCIYGKHEDVFAVPGSCLPMTCREA